MKKFTSIFYKKENITKVILKYIKLKEHQLFDCFKFKESVSSKKYILLLREFSPLFPLKELVIRRKKVIYHSSLFKSFTFSHAAVFKIPEYESKYLNFCTIFVFALNAIKKGGKRS
ncbi:MAG: hypothetical protein LWW95_08205 [Candidatus Desulfofervidus auxilii]|nr:hypothetical protein [Candidatus Desulfofervidus auxilii]